MQNKLSEHLTRQPGNQGVLFLMWLKNMLQNGSLSMNQKSSDIHVVPEGVFLVSPRIFQRFSQRQWKACQKSFFRLGIAQVNDKGNSFIYQYDVLTRNGTRTLHKVNGIVIPQDQAQKLLPQLDLGKLNTYLARPETVGKPAKSLWSIKIGRSTYRLIKQ